MFDGEMESAAQRSGKQIDELLACIAPDHESRDLTPKSAQKFHIMAVRAGVGRHDGLLWPAFSLARQATTLKLASSRFDGSVFEGALEAGSVSIIAPGACIESDWLSRPQAHYIHFADDEVEEALARSGRGRTPQLRSELSVDDAVLRGLFSNLVLEAEQGWRNGEMFGEWLAMATLERAVQVNVRESQPSSDGTGKLSARQLARVLGMIEARIDQDVSLTELADAAGLSRYHFARCFRGSLGVSPVQHVINRRLERASKLLTASRLPVIEVALACGYDNTSNFARAFKQRYGVTPTQYARQ